MKRSRFATLLFIVGLLGIRTAAGQEPPKPGPEHAVLKEMEGNWDAAVTMEGTPASKAVATYKMDLGGLWLVSSFAGDVAGMKFQGHGVDGYDPAKKKYTAVWADSFSTALLIMEGDYDAKTKTITMTAEHPGPDGKPAKFKTVSTSKDQNHHTFKMYMTPQGGKESLMMTIEYTRKK